MLCLLQPHNLFPYNALPGVRAQRLPGGGFRRVRLRVVFRVGQVSSSVHMLPRGEQSVKKELLRFTLWGLSSAILFGFAYQFGTFMPLSAVVLMYCIAVSSSLLLFYAYYIVDDQNHTGCSFCATMPPHSSCPNQEKTNNSDNV
ncbi:uncharacterized protein Pyn_10609 [Prunus yedoensis var. nudiflora]|uniref:Uncharacterized protein n=1 Tax=Prunus yedoensis var. nudiflora TaxID=2094558 RepID=A0A314ZY81_PRUYE|nr:uncharacterized protein Pyn_10609 [Prunus yedoensis var. nudiflora]